MFKNYFKALFDLAFVFLVEARITPVLFVTQ